MVAIVVMLAPYLTGEAIAKGLDAEADVPTLKSADLYVSTEQFGRPAPISVAVVDRILAMDGVSKIVPRIVGEVTLGKERMVANLLGMPADQLPDWCRVVNGTLPKPGSSHELILGASLARRLGLQLGSVIPPFYRNEREGDRLARVVGIFPADAPLWQANLVVTTLETASAVFDQPGMATELLVWCQGGYQAEVRRAILERLSDLRPRVALTDERLSPLSSRAGSREGVFNLHFVLAFVVGMLVLLVTSGLGLPERRREIGILKATGWQTDEVLLRGLVESVILSLAGACLALLSAWVWLRLGNGHGIAGIFVEAADSLVDVQIPFQLAPVPALLAFVLGLVIVLTGTLYSCWRAAVGPPREAMR